MAALPQRHRPRFPPRVILGLPVLLAAIASCSAPEPPPDAAERALARQYFRDNNAAARDGPRAQQEFLRRTQHPDFAGQACDLGAMTVELDPAMSTLRPDPGFSLDGVAPRGRSWIVAVEVTVRRRGVVIDTQIGSQHIVFLEWQAHGFAPCPT